MHTGSSSNISFMLAKMAVSVPGTIKDNGNKILAALIVIGALAVIGYSLSTIAEVRQGASWMWRQAGYGADYATQGVKYIWRQMGYGVNYTGQGMGYLWRQLGYGATAAGHFLSSPAFLNGLKWTGIGVGGLIVVGGGR